MPNAGTFFNSTWIADGNSALMLPFIGTALVIPAAPGAATFVAWLRLDSGTNALRTAVAQYANDGATGAWKLGAHFCPFASFLARSSFTQSCFVMIWRAGTNNKVVYVKVPASSHLRLCSLQSSARGMA